MFLHLYKGKISGKYRFKILRDSKKSILKSKQHFESKKLRNEFLISLFNIPATKNSIPKHRSKNGLYYFSISDGSGIELARSRKYRTKRKRNKRRKEYINGVNGLLSTLTTNKSSRVEKERQVLKKGTYSNGHFDYSIFLSSNGKHYFTFTDKEDKTVLLNANIQGFKTLTEAENKLGEVLICAKDENLYEIRETKNKKYFFYLFNKQSQKIAKSFFYKEKTDAENIIAQFVGKNSKVKIEPIKPNPENKINPIAPVVAASMTPATTITPKAETPKNEDDLLTDREKYLRQKEAEKIKLEKELEERREKRRLERIEREKTIKEKQINQSATPTPDYYQEDKDGFGGCLKWIVGLLALLLLIILFAWLMKGCGESGNQPIAHIVEIKDSSNVDKNAVINAPVDSTNDKTSEVVSDDEINTNTSEQIAAHNNSSKNKSYSDSSCGCSDAIEIFKVPADKESKSINDLNSNPQLGSFIGTSGNDLIDDLKYQSKLRRSNASFLKYLFQSMGYKGLGDLNAKDISLVNIPAGSKGIMGFGKYNGYKYVSLDVPKRQLEAFKISNTNGCTVYFTKYGGNFFYPCE